MHLPNSEFSKRLVADNAVVSVASKSSCERSLASAVSVPCLRRLVIHDRPGIASQRRHADRQL